MTKRIKKGQELAPLSTIPEYALVAQGAIDLQRRYGKLVFDCSTKAGDKEARRARQDLKDFQAQLEKARVAKKAPLLDFIREIDAEAKRIDKVLEDLKTPIHAQIQAEEQRAERERQERVRAEQKRVEEIERRIENIRESAHAPGWLSVEELQAALVAVEATVIDDSFAEFQDDAQVVKEVAVESLRRQHARAVEIQAEREQAARDRAELEKLRAQAAEFANRKEQVTVPERADPRGGGSAPPPEPLRVSPVASEPEVATSAPIPVLDVLRDALGYIMAAKPPNGLVGRRAQVMATLENAIHQEELKRCLRR